MIQHDSKLPSAPSLAEEQTRILSDTLHGPPPCPPSAAGGGSEREVGTRPPVDRRAFSRRKAKGKITYQIGDWGAGPSYKAEVLDISQNGIGMITDQALAKGTKLRILRETPYRGQKFVVPAEVRWSAILEENKFRVGCSLERRLIYTEMQSFV